MPVEEVSAEVNDNANHINAFGNNKHNSWRTSFKEMAANGDDRLLIPDSFDDEEIKDWNWYFLRCDQISGK